MKKSEAKAAMEKLLRDHIARGREHTKQQAERIERVGQLQSKLIYWCAAGKMPESEIRELDSAIASALDDNA